MSPRMSARYWIERAEASLLDGKHRIAVVYMRRALSDG